MSCLIYHSGTIAVVSIISTIVIEIFARITGTPKCVKGILLCAMNVMVSSYIMGISGAYCDGFSRFVAIVIDTLLVIIGVNGILDGIREMTDRHRDMTEALDTLKAQVQSLQEIKRPAFMRKTECSICLDKGLCTYIIHKDGTVPHADTDHAVCLECLDRMKACPYCRAPLL